MRRVAILFLVLLILCTSCKTDKEKYLNECALVEKSYQFCEYKYAVEVEKKNEDF